MKKLGELTKEEKSLLLYLETRCVDYCGKVDTRMMNEGDFAIAKKWDKESFIIFERIPSCELRSGDGCTNWTKLSLNAWNLAHQERKTRARRNAINFHK